MQMSTEARGAENGVLSRFSLLHDLSLPTYRDVIKDPWKAWWGIVCRLSKFDSCIHNRSSCSWCDVFCTAAIYIQTFPPSECSILALRKLIACRKRSYFLLTVHLICDQVWKAMSSNTGTLQCPYDIKLGIIHI